ncbi:MAG: PQQ-binding-like beta-propeller repeat protein [Planctomycetota bacterium]|nr:PQQ-binding-like beta-propeller repeat protein [Planctomycetota bacterium]
MNWLSPLALVLVACQLTTPLRAGDWPQFRHDAGRTAASPHELPAKLQLRWTRTLPPPRPAFPNEVRLAYDASYEPVVLGHTMFVPSMVTDSVTALDTETGVERWRFITEGPVRFAPVAWHGKVYFVSDDGYLYCLNEDGSVRWKFRGLPEGRKVRKVLGHGRLVSLWPARGGPVLADGVVYFAAGLWPTEGVFVHALDAESGKAVWSNTSCGHIPESNWDHGQGQNAGLTPQGYLAIVGDRLIVPCGAQLPAFLDRKTGTVQTYTTGWGGRVGLPKGCWFVAGVGNYLSHAGDLYDITRRNDERLANPKPNTRNYKPMLYAGGWTRLDIEPANQRELDSFCQPVLTPEVMYASDGGIVARDLTELTLQERTKDNIPSHRGKDELPDNLGGVLRRLWELPSKLKVHIKAGNRLYVGGPGVVEAIDTTAGQEPKVVWRGEFEGTPQRMLAADEKLFIVTAQGSLHAFAAPQSGEAITHVATEVPPPAPDKWTERAKAILETTGVRDGYALVLGIDNGRLVEELVRQSSLQVVAVDGDAGKVASLRERLHLAGLYGTRVSVLVGSPLTYPFPPYLANLVVSETPAGFQQAGERPLAEAVFQPLRPYGGVACLSNPLADRSRLEEIAKGERFTGSSVRQVGDFVLLARSGPLPGAADWSHAEANAASTGASEDEFIRSPMSVLWFDAAQRWHKFPGQNQVRVAGGRVVLYENELLRASDVFTGRQLWEVDLSEKSLDRQGLRYARHRQWGPSASLSPTTELVAIEDAIYLGDGTICFVFDPATGKPTGSLALPEDLKSPWANLRVCDDYLVGTSGQSVLCVNRRTGKVPWRVEAARTSLYLAVGGGKVFCAELADPKRGEDEIRDGSLFALNLATGERLWQRAGGAKLRYSQSLDIVVTPTGFYRGRDGEPLPQKSGATRLVITGGGLPKTGLPGLLAGQKLLTGDDETLAVYDLPSATPVGEPLKWVRRGCTGTRASAHLLTTRNHGTSAWIDLDSREITPFLGIRPGCSVNNNLYPANGVLNMPNLTAGCTCNYAPVSMACVPAGVVERRSAE